MPLSTPHQVWWISPGNTWRLLHCHCKESRSFSVTSDCKDDGRNKSKTFFWDASKTFWADFQFHWWYVAFMCPATEIKVTLNSFQNKCPKASHGRLLHGKCLQELCIYRCSILILSLVWYIPTALQEYDSFLNRWDLWITEQCSMTRPTTQQLCTTQKTHIQIYSMTEVAVGAPTLLHLDLNRTFASTHSTFMSISSFPAIWCSAGAPLSHMPQCPEEHAA